jgi:hypothetical protein
MRKAEEATRSAFGRTQTSTATGCGDFVAQLRSFTNSPLALLSMKNFGLDMFRLLDRDILGMNYNEIFMSKIMVLAGRFCQSGS